MLCLISPLFICLTYVCRELVLLCDLWSGFKNGWMFFDRSHTLCLWLYCFGYCPSPCTISTWTTLFCFYFHAGFSVNVSVDCRILLKVKLFCFVTIYPEATKIKSKYNDIEWLSEEVLKVAPISRSQNENSILSRYKDLFNFLLYTWFYRAFIKRTKIYT